MTRLAVKSGPVKISSYIEQDLEARIRSGQGLPERLTLAAIASMYDVSLTPVRAAVAGLITRRVVRKHDNGRLEVGAVRKRRRATKSAIAGPLPDWDERVARELVLLSLADDSGEFVREEAMAEQLGIGRSMLRSTFQRLAGGGLVEHVPRRGWRVPRFDHDEMDAYLDIRETLEVKALDLARPHLDADELGLMIAGNEQGAIDHGAIDNRLHAYFIKQSGNRYIDAFFASNGRYYNSLFDYAALGTQVVAEMAGQHVEILEHACARRWAKARMALAHHIRSQRPVMAAMIATVQNSTS